MRTRISFLLVFAMVLTGVPLAPAGATSPDLLELDASYTLTDDFQGSIVILGDDVTLDCAGHTINGPGYAPDPEIPEETYDGVTVDIDATGATVKNCVVAGPFGGGISVRGPRATVVGNVVGDNVIGIGVSSDGNVIKNNVSNDNFYNGYLLQYAQNNLLKGNHAAGNVAAFSLEFADNNTLVGNTVSGQGWDLAFEIAGSSGNTLRDNTTSTIGQGFILFPADDFHTGGPVYPNGNTLIGNVATGAGEGWIGFKLEQGSDNAFVANSASGFFHGFRLADAVDNTLIDNTATHNSGDGFIVASSTNNTLKGNLARYNHFGFGLAGSTGNTLQANTARDNDRFGFSAFNYAPGNLLKENKACQNGEYDVWSHSTSPFVSIDNKVCGDSYVAHALVLGGWNADGNAADDGVLLADALTDASGVEFFVVVAGSPREMYDLMCAMPETAVGFVGTSIYSLASEDCAVDASFRAERFGSGWFRSQFVVHEEDEAIAGIADLHDLKWAYPNTGSLSGYVVPLGMMALEGVTAGDVLEAGSHGAAVAAVSDGAADFATTFVSPALPDDVRVLVESPPIPNDAVAFGAQFPVALRTVVESALVEAANTPAIWDASIWSLYRWQGIVPAADADWDWLRTVVDAAGYGINDL